MDHCPAHPSEDVLTTRDGKIKALFLPKNTTSKIQPLDQGIIATFKRNYRRNLISGMIASDKRVTEYLKALNLKESFHIGGKSWDEVTPRCIRGCWRKGLGAAFDDDEYDPDFDGFTEDDITTSERNLQEYDGFNEQDLEHTRTAIGDTNITAEEVQEWLTNDDSEPTYAKLTDEELIANLKDSDVCDDDNDDDRDDDDDANELVKPPPVSDIVLGLERALDWYERHASATAVGTIQLRNILHSARLEARDSEKQVKITDFFVKT